MEEQKELWNYGYFWCDERGLAADAFCVVFFTALFRSYIQLPFFLYVHVYARLSIHLSVCLSIYLCAISPSNWDFLGDQTPCFSSLFISFFFYPVRIFLSVSLSTWLYLVCLSDSLLLRLSLCRLLSIPFAQSVQTNCLTESVISVGKSPLLMAASPISLSQICLFFLGRLLAFHIFLSVCLVSLLFLLSKLYSWRHCTSLNVYPTSVLFLSVSLSVCLLFAL